MIVTLTYAEVVSGALTGLLRNADSIFGEREQTVPGIGEDGLGWTRDIEGALGERAYAKASGRYWDSSLQRFRDAALGDVGQVQVRHTTVDEGHLVVRPHDHEDDWFVLVTGSAPVYQIHGWILGREAKRPEWLVDPGDRGRPCWFVPREALTR